jgi:hypothetical protein
VCGHDCLGGTCAAGACQPIVLESGQPNLADLVVGPEPFGGSGLYYTTASPFNGTVRRCSVFGCGDMQTMRNGQPSPSGVAVTTDHFYWGTDTGIYGCMLTGCGNGLTTTVAAAAVAQELAIDGNTIFWTEQSTGFVRSCDLTSCPTPTLIAQAPSAFGIAVTVNNVFFTTWSSPGKVLSCPRGGCAAPTMPTLVEDMADVPRAILATGGYVYWTEVGVADEGKVRRVKDSGGLPEDFLTSLHHPFALATDGTTMFVANAGLGDTDGSIESCPIASCDSALQTNASHQSHPNAIGVDATAVYWLNKGSGTVMKVAR